MSDAAGPAMGGAVSSYQHDGLTFEVTDSGPGNSRVVILLHGFPEDRHQWAALSALLTTAGYRALAPDQRGYSPSSSPTGRRAYRIDALSGDVLALADAAGAERFDVVGHDWGAVVAWWLAAAYPERVRSLCALSVPHPGAVRQAMLRSSQAWRSWYIALFQLPWLPERLLSARGGRFLASILERQGIDSATAHRFARGAADPGSMTGPLNWYRALPFEARSLPGRVDVPTLFLWGDRERFISRAAANACAGWVDGPYRFEVLAGKSHWLPTLGADEVGKLLVEHLASVAD